MAAVVTLFGLLLGASVGSFVNVVWCLPRAVKVSGVIIDGFLVRGWIWVTMGAAGQRRPFR